jgi:hypothetical protein
MRKKKGKFSYAKRDCFCTNCGEEIEQDDVVWADSSSGEILDMRCAKKLKKEAIEKNIKKQVG